MKKGETLMMIAFENYGDLYKWKRIYEANKDKIKDPNQIPAGTVLTLDKPSSDPQIERNGEKYLIKKGDTLGSISNEVYGTPKKWKKLWKNNKQLIKDPNRIFAGFYLYYLPEGNKDDVKGSTEPMANNDGDSGAAASGDSGTADAPAAANAPPAGAPQAAGTAPGAGGVPTGAPPTASAAPSDARAPSSVGGAMMTPPPATGGMPGGAAMPGAANVPGAAMPGAQK